MKILKVELGKVKVHMTSFEKVISSDLYFLLPDENSRNTVSADKVSYSALKLILFDFAQEENIMYFKTTKSNSTDLLHFCCWTLRRLTPTLRGCLQLSKTSCLVKSEENTFLICSELSQTGGMHGPSIPP